MFEHEQTPTAKQRLLTAATEVFVERGYSAARVSDIVAIAGVAQGTFYLYFKSKQAVFVELIDDFFRELLARTLGQNPATGIESAADLNREITEIWRTILTYCRARPGLTALVLHEAAGLPQEERARLSANYTSAAEALAFYNREAISRGIVRAVNPDLAAWVVIGMVERAVHYAVFIAPEADLNTTVADLVRMELTGLLKIGP